MVSEKVVKTLLISFIILGILYLNRNFMEWLLGDLYSFIWLFHGLTILPLLYLLVIATYLLYFRVFVEKVTFAEGIKRKEKSSRTSRLLSYLKENSRDLIKGFILLITIFVGQVAITFSVSTIFLLDFIEVMFFQTAIILSLIYFFPGKGEPDVSGGMAITPYTLGGVGYAMLFFILLYQGT